MILRCPQHLDQLPYKAREPGLPFLGPLSLFPVEACSTWVTLTVASHSYRWYNYSTVKYKPPPRQGEFRREGPILLPIAR